MRRNVFIKPDTYEALAKLGGKTPAENIRRAVALAEVAGELAEALEKCRAAMQSGSKHGQAIYDAEFALNEYEEAKNVN